MSTEYPCHQYKRLGQFEAIALVNRNTDGKLVWRHRNNGKTTDYDPSQFSKLQIFEIYVRYH